MRQSSYIIAMYGSTEAYHKAIETEFEELYTKVVDVIGDNDLELDIDFSHAVKEICINYLDPDSFVDPYVIDKSKTREAVAQKKLDDAIETIREYAPHLYQRMEKPFKEETVKAEVLWHSSDDVMREHRKRYLRLLMSEGITEKNSRKILANLELL